jgi:protein-S-isoprenylcysteine O-methyltransferase Ste14
MGWLWAAWGVFLIPFAVNHWRVRRERRREESTERRLRRDPASNRGLALQLLAIGLALGVGGAERSHLIKWALALCAVATLLTSWALAHLGRQWRIQAVVAEDQQLVTTGAYRLVRHPVYLALLLMLTATVMVRAHWAVALIATAVYLWGTEIRVRAEDRLLEAHFGAAFVRFAQRTRAYLPLVR